MRILFVCTVPFYVTANIALSASTIAAAFMNLSSFLARAL